RAPSARRFAPGPQRREVALQLALDDGSDERGLGREVLIERPDADARARGHVARAQPLVARAREQLLARVEHRLDHRDRSSLARSFADLGRVGVRHPPRIYPTRPLHEMRTRCFLAPRRRGELQYERALAGRQDAIWHSLGIPYVDVMDIVIVGGGIGGLAFAGGLARRNVNVRVIERAPALREVGAGISLWPNAVRAVERL